MIDEKSCGCIIIENKKVLLVKQVSGNWGFPKGHTEKNETEFETAIRETKEETNLDVEILANTKRYSIQYTTDKGKLKEAVYFLAKVISRDVIAQEVEISDIQWFSFEDALERINFSNLKELFKNVLEDIKAEN